MSFLAALCVQFIVIGLLFLKVRTLQRKLKSPVPDETASDLMRNLLNGGAIAVVRVIDPESIFLLSPKDRG